MMKHYILSVIAVFLLLSGCAGHFYAIEGSDIHLYLRAPDKATVLFVSSLDGYQFHEAMKVKRDCGKLPFRQQSSSGIFIS